MKADTALDFLRQHQPLPPTAEASDELLRQFDEVRRFFTGEISDYRAVPLLLGALGEGDGHGRYSMVEMTLQAYPDEVVVSALKDALESRHASVRYWSAQFAANYASEALLDRLVKVCRTGDVDQRIAAITAIEAIGTASARAQLQQLRSLDLELPVRKMIDAALKG